MKTIKLCTEKQYNYFLNLCLNYSDLLYGKEFTIDEINNNLYFIDLLELNNVSKQIETILFNDYKKDTLKKYILSNELIMLICRCSSNNNIIIDFLFLNESIELKIRKKINLIIKMYKIKQNETL